KSAYILDEEQIRKEEQYDGYYAVATNLVLDPVKDILDISHKRYQIEVKWYHRKEHYIDSNVT
ncbi:MAG: hypothetical protein PUE89_06745, partial [Lachnospiraceae bacterium]|nr:hypothetical protein [Lachnospiraceae bacterium]